MVTAYHFWDVVEYWAKEHRQHESIVARDLGRGVIQGGLQVNSISLGSMPGNRNAIRLGGLPHVGYYAKPGGPLMILRVDALDHLHDIANGWGEPLPDKLSDVLISRPDFRAWCESTGRALARFWFGEGKDPLVRSESAGKAHEAR